MEKSDILLRHYRAAYKARGDPIPGRDINAVVSIGVGSPIQAICAGAVINKLYPDTETNPFTLLTSGFLISGEMGLPDTGEIGPKKLLEATGRLVKLLEQKCPNIVVAGDFDHGYGNAEQAAKFIEKGIRLGVAGFNIEDQQAVFNEAPDDLLSVLRRHYPSQQLNYLEKNSVVFRKSCGHVGSKKVLIPGRYGGGKVVLPLDVAAKKINAIAKKRDQLKSEFGHVAINARTDVFSTYELSQGEKAIEDALTRGEVYLKVGADLIFYEAPPEFGGLNTVDVVKRLVEETEGPVSINLLRGGRTSASLTREELDRLGVARISMPIAAIGVEIAALTQAYNQIISGDDQQISTVPFDVIKDALGWPRTLKKMKKFPYEVLKQGGPEALDELIASIDGKFEEYLAKR